MAELPTLRSFLYAPASSPRILSKVLDAGADAVILDLEDAVPLDRKVEARQTAADFIAAAPGERASQLHVRVNPGEGDYDGEDVAAVVQPGLDALRLPKAENAERVSRLASLLDRLERERGLAPGTVRLYPTVENVAGLDRVDELARASSRVAAIAFGPSDFAADLGLAGGDDPQATLLARSTLVHRSRLAGIGPPVDGAFTALDDPDGLRELAAWVRRLGFVGKSAIHPRQLPILHDVFTPRAEEVDRARRIVASLEDGRATAVVDGSFVDPAVVNRARAVLDLVDRLPERQSDDPSESPKDQE